MFLVQVGICALISGCGSEREDALKGLDLKDYSVGRISFTNRSQQTVDLNDSTETQFFIRQLIGLSSRREENVNNEFDITVYKEKPETPDIFKPKLPVPPRVYVSSLRMGKDCIGPMVPASEEARRWYFENDSLYTLIKGKFQRFSTHIK